MATKNTKEPETIAAPVIEDDGREDIYIPRGDPKGDPNLYVSVNDYTAVLPRGKTSRVPHYVAAEIRRSWEAENAYFESSQEREIKHDDAKAFA